MKRGETYLYGYLHTSVSSPLPFQSDHAVQYRESYVSPSHTNNLSGMLMIPFPRVLGEVLVVRR